MTAPNHIVGGIAITGISLSFWDINIFSNPLYLSVCIFSSLLPDIDHTKSMIGKLFYPVAKYLDIKFGHRTITHSLTALIPLFLFLLFIELNIINPIYNLKGYNYSLIFIFSYLSHLILDMLTVAGIPLFYPFLKNPCVIPANPTLRFRSGNIKSEALALVLFTFVIVSSCDLFQNGFWTTYNRSFGTIKHAYREFKDTNKFIEVEYSFYEFGEHKQGKGYIISSSKNKVDIFNNSRIININNTNSNQKQVSLKFKKSDKIYKYKTIEFTNKTEQELNKICRYNIVKGQLVGSNSFLFNNSKKYDNDISLNNVYSPYFQFISNDSLKKSLKKELRLKELKLKTIQHKNYKKSSELNKLKSKLNLAKKLRNQTTDIYLKNKYESEIIKYNKKIENFNVELESVSEIKAEISYTKELINTDNPNYFSGKIQILEIPKQSVKKEKDSLLILKNQTYTVIYSTQKKCAIKTIHKLKTSDLNNVKINRGYFIEDKRIKQPITNLDYQNSGFSKGHLVPSEDRKQNTKQYNETFLLSNITPQLQNFNAGIWLRLERKTRNYVKKTQSEITIYTGCIFQDDNNFISDKNIQVPKAFYKIIIDKNKYKAFIIPHKESVKTLENFSVKIDSLEAKKFKTIKM